MRSLLLAASALLVPSWSCSTTPVRPVVVEPTAAEAEACDTWFEPGSAPPSWVMGPAIATCRRLAANRARSAAEFARGYTMLEALCARVPAGWAHEETRAACLMVAELGQAWGTPDPERLELGCRGTPVEACRARLDPAWRSTWVTLAVREAAAASLLAELEATAPTEPARRAALTAQLTAITTPASSSALIAVRDALRHDTSPSSLMADALAALDADITRDPRAASTREALLRVAETSAQWPAAEQASGRAELSRRAVTIVGAWHAHARQTGSWIAAHREARAFSAIDDPATREAVRALGAEGASLYDEAARRHAKANRPLMARLHTSLAAMLADRWAELPPFEVPANVPRLVVTVRGDCPWLLPLHQSVHRGPELAVTLTVERCSSTEARTAERKHGVYDRQVSRTRKVPRAVFVPGDESCFTAPNGSRTCTGSPGRWETRDVEETVTETVQEPFSYEQRVRTLTTETSGQASLRFAGRAWQERFDAAPAPDVETVTQGDGHQHIVGTPSSVTLEQHRALARAALDAWLESLRGAVTHDEIERLSRAAERAQPDDAGELALHIMLLKSDAEAPRALAARMGIDAWMLRAGLDGRLPLY